MFKCVLPDDEIIRDICQQTDSEIKRNTLIALVVILRTLYYGITTILILLAAIFFAVVVRG